MATTTLSAGQFLCVLDCAANITVSETPVSPTTFGMVCAGTILPSPTSQCQEPTSYKCGYIKDLAVSATDCLSVLSLNPKCTGNKAEAEFACLTTAGSSTDITTSSPAMTSSAIPIPPITTGSGSGSGSASSNTAAGSTSATTASSVTMSVPTAASGAGNATSSISPKETKTPSNSKGLTSGAAAGVGIGSAIAGAVVAGLILLLLFSRYKKRHQAPINQTGHLPKYNSGTGSPQNDHMGLAKSGGLVVESYLPQPAEDDAISGEMSRLRDKIKDHIQSFYRTTPVNPRLIDPNDLRQLASATGVEVGRMQELLTNSQSRTAALRLYLAWVVLSNCVGPDVSLLPAEIATFAASLAGNKDTDSGKNKLASQWKVLSGALLQNKPGQQQTTSGAPLEHSIEQVIQTADAVLTHFAAPPSGTDKRLRNLESIVRRASQLALLLFSQPSSWDLDWTSPQSGTMQPGRLVVYPGLLETVDENGVAQQPPRLFYPPEVVSTV